MSRILIVDDEESICWALRESLTDDGHDVEVASTAEEGLRVVETGSGFDAVLLDVRLPGMDGLTALRKLQQRPDAAPVVVMTAFGNLETAVQAIEGGAFDYLVKPFDLDRASEVLGRALSRTQAEGKTSSGKVKLSNEELIGASPVMQALFKNIALVAPTDVPVLITGESGTGKELVARAIHRHSRRRLLPFVPVCVPALNAGLVERELFGHVKGAFTGAEHDRKGLLELAHGGSILLDEVGDVPLPLQVKLLRAIEHREITPVGDARPRTADIRVLAATNRPLGEMMTTGQFREDLFFRLSVFPIHVPPLRERLDDIPALAHHFLREANLPSVVPHLSAEVIHALRARSWVGNVRELRNAIERAAIVARGQPVRVEHLPAPMTVATSKSVSSSNSIDQQMIQWLLQAKGQRDPSNSLYDRFLEYVEPPFLKAVLDEVQGNRAAASELLGIHRATLRQKLKRYGQAGGGDRTDQG